MLVKATCCYTDLGKIRISSEVTSLCPFNCFYCYRSKEGINLDLSLLEKRVSILREVSDDFLITGGEPFIHPHIDKILSMLSEYQFTVAVSTSGYKIDKYRRYLLESYKVRSLNLSLDSCVEEINDFIRGKGAYKWFKTGLKVAKELKETHNTRIKVQIVLSEYNKHTLERTVEYLSRSDVVDVIVISSIFPNTLRIDGLEDTLEKITDKKIVLLNINLDGEYPCILGKLVHILPNGKILPCPLLRRVESLDLRCVSDAEEVIRFIRKYSSGRGVVRVCPAILSW